MTTFNIAADLSSILNMEVRRPLCRDLLDEIIREHTVIIVDALAAIMDLELLDPADYVGETLTITIRIKPEDEEGEESQEAEE